jgi:hypothetical protein
MLIRVFEGRKAKSKRRVLKGTISIIYAHTIIIDAYAIRCEAYMKHRVLKDTGSIIKRRDSLVCRACTGLDCLYV